MKYKNYKWDDISEYIIFSKLSNIEDKKDLRNEIYTVLEYFLPYTEERNIIYSVNGQLTYILAEHKVLCIDTTVRNTIHDLFGNVIHYSFLNDIIINYCKKTFNLPGLSDNDGISVDLEKVIAGAQSLVSYKRINKDAEKLKIKKHIFKHNTFAKILADAEKNKECKQFLNILDYLIYDISENTSYSINDKCLYYLKDGILRYDINKFSYFCDYPLTDNQIYKILIDFIKYKFDLTITSCRYITDIYMHPAHINSKVNIIRDDKELSKYCSKKFLA